MFYSFLKVLVGFVLKIFLKKIYISGTEYVHQDRPQLIASNHPNGFLEPLVMACFMNKPLHFLVRGDVFDNPILKPLLRATNQIPIFRFRDGFAKMRENSQTVDESIDVLLNKKNLLIFVEGGTESIKKLRPLQKGMTRIAFQALDKNKDLNLEILPVGINFSYPSKFNSVVMLRIGQPIKVSEFTSFGEDQRTAQQDVLNITSEKMKNNIVHIENEDRLQLFEDLVVIQRSQFNETFFPRISYDNTILDTEINLAKLVDSASESTKTETENKVRELKLKTGAGDIHFHRPFKPEAKVINYIVLLIGFIPALVGAFTNGLYVILGYSFRQKVVKVKEFKASILMVSTMLLAIINYLVLFIIFIIFNIPLFYLIIIFMFGLWWRYYYHFYTSKAFWISKAYRKSIFEEGHFILNNFKNQ